MINLPAFNRLPRAIAFDLDGTLFDSRLEISRRSRQAMRRCQANGIALLLATSRPARSVLRLCEKELLSCCSVVFSNGAIARAVAPLSGELDTALGIDLAQESIRNILELAPQARITLEIHGFEFGMNRVPTPTELWDINSATPDMLLDLDEAIKRNPRKIAVGGFVQDRPLLYENLQCRFRGRLQILPANGGTFLNIVREGVSKSNALAALLSSRHILPHELMVFGDDLPDLDMLSNCGYPVAMANAVEGVKAVCPYQTLSNDEDGVALVLEKMLEEV